jgi:hypothetical protein
MIKSTVLTLGVILAVAAFVENAQAQCFASQTVPKKMNSPDEQGYTFQTPMHLCDGNSSGSGEISNAVVLIVRTQRSVPKLGQLIKVGSIYFELNYYYYNGAMTWGGSQPVILTVQDKNNNDLLPPIYNGNTPRDGCHYGHAIPFSADGPLPDIFDQIEFVTFQVPRVSGVQHGC